MRINPDGRHAEPVSALLVGVAERHPGPRIALRELVDALGDRAFGLLMLLLALPNSFPIPSPPGFSTLFGAPLMLVSLQLAVGRERPWLPRRLLDKTVAQADLLRFLRRAEPYMQKMERRVRPRWEGLASGWGERLVGLVCCAMAGIMALPIIFGNFPPALSISILSLGLIEKDGVAVAVGLLGSVIATVIVGLVLYIGVEAIHAAARSLF